MRSKARAMIQEPVDLRRTACSADCICIEAVGRKPSGPNTVIVRIMDHGQSQHVWTATAGKYLAKADFADG